MVNVISIACRDVSNWVSSIGRSGKYTVAVRADVIVANPTIITMNILVLGVNNVYGWVAGGSDRSISGVSLAALVAGTE